MTASSGAVLGATTYTPFGTPENSPIDDTPFGFTGEYTDDNDQIIFGTGDELGIITLTANTRAVTYVQQYISSFRVLTHSPARFRENFV